MKQHVNQNNISLSTETIFEQAWDDITVLANAVKAWPTGNGAYVPEYLLLLMAAQADRGKTALTLLNTMDVTEHQEALKELNELFMTSRKRFLDILSEYREDIDLLCRKQQGLGLRLTSLEEQLATVQRIVEDGILFDNANWLQEELHLAGEEFLQVFTDMARMVHGAPPELTSVTSFTQWRSTFKQLEKKFKNLFSFFSSLNDTLQHLRQKEYGQQEFWWLHEAPADEPIFETILPEEQLPALGKFILPRSNRQTVENNCPDQELVIAYALGDAIGKQNRQLVHEHIQECDACLDTILDVRAADAEVKEIMQKQTTQSEPSIGTEVTAAEWKERLQTIPAWLLLPEQQDIKIAIEFSETIPSVQAAEGLPPFTAAALSTLPAAGSLPPIQDSNQQAITLAKVVTVAGEEMMSLHFVQLYIDVFLFEDEKLYIVGRLEDFTPTAATQWHSDWASPDGSVTMPEQFQVTDTGVTIIFDFHGLSEKPAGELRVLFIKNQE